MKISPLVKTLVLVGVFLALTLTNVGLMAFFGSFVLVMVAIVFLPWAIYSLVRIVIRPAERRSRAIKLVLWGAALVVAVSARSHWDTNALAEANKIASAVQAHKGRTGAYPNSLGEAGFDAQALKKKFSMSYRVSDGKAYLFYSQPSMPSVAHHYTFETNSWETRD